MEKIYKIYEDDSDDNKNQNGNNTDDDSGDGESKENAATIAAANDQLSKVNDQYSKAKTKYMNDVKDVETRIQGYQKVLQDENATDEMKQKARESIEMQLNMKITALDTFTNSLKLIRQAFKNANDALVTAGKDPVIKIPEKEEIRISFSKKLFEAVNLGRTEEMAKCIKSAMDSVESISYTFDETPCRTFAKRIISYINNDKDFRNADNRKEMFDEFVTNIFSSTQKKLQEKEIESLIAELDNILENNVMFAWIFE